MQANNLFNAFKNLLYIKWSTWSNSVPPTLWAKLKMHPQFFGIVLQLKYVIILVSVHLRGRNKQTNKKKEQRASSEVLQMSILNKSIANANTYRQLIFA
jgi:hypothetical protein